MQADEPMKKEKYPASQSVQTVPAELAWKVPVKQAEHLVDPSSELM